MLGNVSVHVTATATINQEDFSGAKKPPKTGRVPNGNAFSPLGLVNVHRGFIVIGNIAHMQFNIQS